MNDADAHPAGWSDDRLLSACEVRFVRRSGPGGQHRNKVSSGVQLVYEPAGMTVEANERRSQHDNRRVALRRLRLALAVGVRTPSAAGPPPSEWRERIKAGRIIISLEHADYPRFLAVALDCLAAVDWDVPRAAAQLGCTGTQLVRFIAGAPAALVRLNQERGLRGLKPLSPR
ncbi:MAG: peptide chain release factor-like protein [Planctomycetaceae bacterium]